MWGSQILSFGVAVTFWPGLISSATAPRWGLLAIGLPLVAWLDPRAVDWRVLAIAVGFVGYSVLSLLWTPDVLTGANDLFRLLIITTAFIAGASFDLDKTLTALGWGVSASMIFVFLQMAGHPLIAGLPAAGLFFNREVLGETAAPLLVWVLLTRRWSLSAILGLAVLLTQSRAGMIAAVGAIAIMYPRRAWMPLLAMGFIANALYILGLPPFTPDKIMSLGQRVMAWQWALSGLSWFGNGIGSFAALYPQAEYAHSDFLQLAFEAGIIGVATGAAIFILLWRRSAGAERALLVALGIEAALSFPLHMPVAAFMAALLAGWVVRSRDPLRDRGYVSGGRLGLAV